MSKFSTQYFRRYHMTTEQFVQFIDRKGMLDTLISRFKGSVDGFDMFYAIVWAEEIADENSIFITDYSDNFLTKLLLTKYVEYSTLTL